MNFHHNRRGMLMFQELKVSAGLDRLTLHVTVGFLMFSQESCCLILSHEASHLNVSILGNT